MSNPSKFIEEFVYNQFGKDSNGLTKFIKNTKAHFILNQIIKDVSDEYYAEIMEQIDRQRLLYQVFEQELTDLHQKFTDNGVRMINLKGFYLANDLYEPIELRKSGDIDILVKAENVSKALEILRKNAYRVVATGEQVSPEIASISLDSLVEREIHFPVFYKEVQINDQTVNIHMDFHISIFHKLEDKIVRMNQMIDRAEMVEVNGRRAWVLELHDRLIHLLGHFSKEYVKVDSHLMFTRGIKPYPEVKLLHDIALMLSKYQSVIQWNVVMERVRELKKSSDVYLALSVLDVIYTDVIPSVILKQLKEDSAPLTHSFMGQFYENLGHLDPKLLLLSEPSELISDFLSRMRMMGPRIESHYTIGNWDSASLVYLGGKDRKAGNIYNSHVKNGDANGVEASFQTTWNEQYFSIRASMKDQNMSLSKLPSMVVSLGSKELSKLTDTKYYIPKIPIKLKYEGAIPVMNLRGIDLVPEASEYPYKIEISEKEINVEVKFPWRSLGISCDVGDEYFLDLEFAFYNENGHEKTRLAWANLEKLQEPTLLGIVKLHKEASKWLV